MIHCFILLLVPILCVWDPHVSFIHAVILKGRTMDFLYKKKNPILKDQKL